MRIAAWALATSSRCSESVSVADPGAQRVHLVADRGHGRRPLLAFGGQRVAVSRRRLDHLVQPRRQQPPGVGHRGGHRGRPQSRGVRLLRPAPAPRVRRRPHGAANPPVRAPRWRVPRRSAPPAGLPPRRRGRLRRRRRSAAGPSPDWARPRAPAGSLAALRSRVSSSVTSSRVCGAPGFQLLALPQQPAPLVFGARARPAPAGPAARTSPRSRRRIR